MRPRSRSTGVAAALFCLLGCEGGAHSVGVGAEPLAEVSEYGRIGTITQERAATREAMAAAPVEHGDVRVVPLDLSTATQRTTPCLTVLDDRDALPVAEQEAWFARVRLIELRSGRELAIATHYVPPTPGTSDHGHRIVVAPQQPFVDSWHALEIDMRDADGHTIQSGLHPTQSGIWSARFRPDSHPIITAVRTESSDNEALLEVVFSERVMPAADGSFLHLSVGGRSVGCVVTTQFVHATPPIDPYGDGTADDVSVRPEAQARVALRCDQSIEEPATLEIADGVATIFGTPVFGLDDTSPGRVSWDPSEVRLDGPTRELALAELLTL